MIQKVKEQVEFCRCNWKTIFVGSFFLHFIFDWFIFGLGIMFGMHIGH